MWFIVLILWLGVFSALANARQPWGVLAAIAFLCLTGLFAHAFW